VAAVLVTAALAYLAGTLFGPASPLPGRAADGTPGATTERVRCVTATGSVDVTAGPSMAWAPDRDALAVARPRGGHAGSDIVVIEPPGWSPRVLGSGTLAVWSSSGRRLALLDGARLLIDAASATILDALDVQFANAAWQGEQLVYWARDALWIWDGGSIRQLSALQLGEPLVPEATDAALSADGLYFALVRFDPFGNPRDLTIGETATGQGRREEAPSQGLSWSTKGHRLLLVYDDRYDLVTAGTTVRATTPRGATTMFGWDPSGGAALLGTAGGASIQLDGWDGDRRAPRLELPGGFMGIAASTDGRYVASRVATAGGTSVLRIRSCTSP
jgi:hypothetical protein